MTLLTRGITSSRQGLSYLDKAIQKSEAADKEFQNNLDTYNDLLSGVKSGGTYLGQSSRNILNEYARAFESAIDSYAADPSAENEQRIQELKIQTNDFYNRAVAARQNSISQLKGVRENPSDYSISLSDAQSRFAEIEDADPTARFDPETMTMYVGDGRSEMTLGNIGYYNGSDPMFFSKAAQLGAIKAEGEWGASHLEQFMGMIDPNDKEGREKIIEAFMETARPSSSAYQETAIYNYLQDKKGLDLTQIDNETELQERILEVRNDASELTAALRHMGELEYNYMAGAKAAKGIAAANATFNELFRGDVDSRGDRPGPEPYTYTQTGETGAAERYSDPFAGVEGVRMLETPLTTDRGEGGIAGLDEYTGAGGFLVGYDVDALGRIVAEVHKEVPDPDDEEKRTYVNEFITLEEGDLYENLRADLKKKGIFSLLQEQSIARQASHEKAVNDRRIAEAYANSDLEPPLPELRLTTTPEDVKAATGPSLNQRRREQRQEEIEDIQDQFNFTGNNAVIVSPTTGRRGFNVSGINKKFVQRLVDEGYSNQEIKDGIEYMQQNDITVQVSPLRNFFQNLSLPTRFGRVDAGLGGDDMGKAVDEFQEALRKSSPVYEDKYTTDPKPMGSDEEARRRSRELFGRNFTGSGAVVDTIFEEEGYSADGILVNVPPTENSGVTIGGLDLGDGAGNIEQKLDILEKYIPEDQMEALKPLAKLTGPQAQAALQDSLDTGQLKPDTWGFTDNTFKQIQSDFVESNTLPSVTRKLKANGVTDEQINNLPEEVLSAIVSMEFMTPGSQALKAVAKAIKSGNREDWLEAASQYDVYYGGSESEQRKLEDGTIMQGNIDRAKRAASAIRSVYS